MASAVECEDSGTEVSLLADLIGRRRRSTEETRRLLLPEPPLVTVASADVRRLVELIHKRAFDSRVNVKVLRYAAAARDHNVSSRFKAMIGLSIADYIATLRVRAGAHLLRTSGLSIAEISQTVGYEYIQTFYRDVRRVFGTTPGSLRRNTSRSQSEVIDSPTVIEVARERNAPIRRTR